MTTLPIAFAQQRLAQQRLAGNPLTAPEEVVAGLGAVQAQDFQGATWALGLRLEQAEHTTIEHAFNIGTILRTHVMRPTWHFVTPDDIRWLLELTAPRVNAVNARIYRQLELDGAVFAQSNAVLAAALEGNRHRTRAELGAALTEAGIAATGLRLIYMLQRAELDAVICSGGRRGRQFTYALLDERAPRARRLRRDEAVAELTQRYFSGHGPATVHDFVWWSGLTVADVRAGLDMVRSHLTSQTVEGRTYWFSTALCPPNTVSPSAHLLPTYDEFLIGFAAFGQARTGGWGVRREVVFNSTLVIDGLVAGSWRRSFKGKAMIIEIAPFVPLTTAEQEAVTAAARRYGDFFGAPVLLA